VGALVSIGPIRATALADAQDRSLALRGREVGAEAIEWVCSAITWVCSAITRRRSWRVALEGAVRPLTTPGAVSRFSEVPDNGPPLSRLRRTCLPLSSEAVAQRRRDRRTGFAVGEAVIDMANLAATSH
jgi:hypothetical protein